MQRLLIEAGSAIERELYLGLVLDRATAKIVFMASQAGGMEIEKVAHDTPELIFKETIEPAIGFQPYQARKLAFKLGLDAIEKLTGQRPLGWYTGRDSPRTRRLVVDDGGLEYDSDYYGDDLPFWMKVQRSDGAVVPHLVLPYTLDTNDMRFSLPQGFSQGEDFFTYLRDSFDCLYAEGAESPKMLSVGMHCRLLGRPGRMLALQKFLDHIQRHDRVWICRRIDIARHWKSVHPYNEQKAG